ncbi:MAG: hypothetical protein PHH08_00805, partial [Candidatus ainarchaeum sp.]|nr:hypothetical protein [Candidatus ainarchaeum sp.]
PNEIIVLQADPVIEFIATGKLGKEISFSYSIAKKIVDKNIFTTPIVLNQTALVSVTCEKGCDDKNPCTKDQCINEKCIFFMVQDNTPCGYAQKCRKGICVAYPTTGYNAPMTIFGQKPEVIALITVIIVICAAIGIYYYKKYPKGAAKGL